MQLVPWTSKSHGRRGDVFGSMIDSLFGGSALGLYDTTEGFVPPVNIAETDKAFTVSVELPGVSEKDIDVQLVGDELSIRAERKSETKEEGKTFHRVESRYGKYVRTLRINEDLQANAVDAVFDKGVLTITIPKAEPTPASKISIRTNAAD